MTGCRIRVAIAEPNLVHLHQPASAATDGRAPLVVLLHGIRSNEQDLFGLASTLDPRFQVVSLRGPITFAPGAYGWFNVAWETGQPVHDPSDSAASLDVLARVPEWLSARYDADPAQVFFVGFSQGGIMTMSTLLAHPGVLAGAVVMSGRTLPDALPPQPPPGLSGFPVMVVHGTRDTVLPLHPYGNRTREVLESVGADLLYREYEMGHEVSARSWSDVCSWLTRRLEGGKE